MSDVEVAKAELRLSGPISGVTMVAAVTFTMDSEELAGSELRLSGRMSTALIVETNLSSPSVVMPSFFCPAVSLAKAVTFTMD